MDRLKDTDLMKHLTGKVYLSQFQALSDLDPETVSSSKAMTPKKAAE